MAFVARDLYVVACEQTFAKSNQRLSRSLPGNSPHAKVRESSSVAEQAGLIMSWPRGYKT